MKINKDDVPGKKPDPTISRASQDNVTGIGAKKKLAANATTGAEDAVEVSSPLEQLEQLEGMMTTYGAIGTTDLVHVPESTFTFLLTQFPSDSFEAQRVQGLHLLWKRMQAIAGTAAAMNMALNTPQPDAPAPQENIPLVAGGTTDEFDHRQERHPQGEREKDEPDEEKPAA